MKLVVASALWLAAGVLSEGYAEPTDLTGLSCERETKFGKQTWEFYGDVAIRYYEDGSVLSLPRVGGNAYEKYGTDGEWSAIFSFYEFDDGVALRILARPGLLVREENRFAPLEKGMYWFEADCVPIWER